MKNLKSFDIFESAPGLSKEEIPKSVFQKLFKNRTKPKFLNNELELNRIKYKKDIPQKTEIFAIKDEDNFILISPSYSKYYDAIHYQNGKEFILRTKTLSKILKYITKDHKIYEVLNNKSKKQKKGYEKPDYKTLENFVIKKITELRDKTSEDIVEYIREYTGRYNDKNPAGDMIRAIGNMNYMMNESGDMLLYSFGRLFRFYEKDGYEEDDMSKKEEILIYIKNIKWEDFVDTSSSREIKTKAAEKFIKRKNFNL